MVSFLIHSGAKQDPIGLEGLAHFTEHALSKNISISYDEIKNIFEAEGGFARLGSTNFLGTKYEFFSSIENKIISQAISIFGELIFSAKIEKEIENESKIILNEFNRAFPLKIDYEEEVRKKQSVFHGHWLERFTRTLGSPETINKITQKDLQDFYNSQYIPKNISVVAVGGLKIDEIKKIFEDSVFSQEIKGGERTPIEEPIININPPTENRHLIKASEKISEKNLINFAGYESVCMLPGDIKYADIKILKGMLNKLLMKEIRENKGWTYSVKTNCHDFGNFYELSINCNNFAPTAVDEMEKIVENCIKNISINNDLFEKIKQREIRSCDMLDLSAEDLCDSATNDLMIKHRIITHTEFLDDFQNSSLDKICKITEFLKPEKRWTSILIP
jgi:predicted Zn-dependent peptidase